jgi:DNA-binding FadR family transcriptional regulator
MEKIRFEPLLNRRASESIEQKIKEAIFTGKLKPGDRLPTEKEMAAQFGVSIVTLREALKSLEIYGIIGKKKGKWGGTFVSKVDSQSIKYSLNRYLNFKDLSPQHLYDVRKILEPKAARLAALERSPEEIKKLEESVLYSEGKIRDTTISFSDKDFFDIDTKSIEFHKIIAESTHNPILALTIDYIFDFLYESEANILMPDINFCIDSVLDHRNILELLKQGDSEKCENEMALHLHKLDKHLLKMKEKQFMRGDIISDENKLLKKELVIS